MPRTILKTGQGVLNIITNRKLQKGKSITVYLDGHTIFHRSLANRFKEVFWQDGYTFTAYVNGLPLMPPEAKTSMFEHSLEIETDGDVNVLYR